MCSFESVIEDSKCNTGSDRAVTDLRCNTGSVMGVKSTIGVTVRLSWVCEVSYV